MPIFESAAIAGRHVSSSGGEASVTPSALRVISIGISGPPRIAHDSFLTQNRCDISNAATYRELCAVEIEDRGDVAALHPTLSRNEIWESAHFIRRRWPDARIPVIRSDALSIDDALHDDRVMPKSTRRSSFPRYKWRASGKGSYEVETSFLDNQGITIVTHRDQ